MALNGHLDLTQSEVTSDVSLDQIDLPALQDLAPSLLAATFTAGRLNAQANVQVIVRRRSVQRACRACDRVARPGRVARPWPTGDADGLDPAERLD